MAVFKRFYPVVLILLCFSPLTHASVEKERETALNAFKNGDYQDALELYTTFLEDVSDEESGLDLQRALSCLVNINRSREQDGFLEKTVENHPENFFILEKAARYYRLSHPHGSIIDGEYIRSSHEGERANSFLRDRVRSLQLYQQAETVIPDSLSPRTKGLFYLDCVTALKGNNYSPARLQSLTDLTTLPDYSMAGFSNPFARHYNSYGISSGAPTTPDGDPIYYAVPESFSEAKSDGERWRFLLSQAGKVDSNLVHTVQNNYADFLHEQFSVQTLKGNSWMRSLDLMKQEDTAILALHTLTDEETTAKLASGVKRFTLPREHNFIHIKRELFEAGHLNGVELANIYLDRLQYEKAADVLRESLARQEDEDLRHQLESITGDWVRFEDQQRAFSTGKEAKLGIIFRNATSAQLSVTRINMDKIYAETIQWVKSNPENLDWYELNYTNLTRKVMHDQLSPYLEKTVSTETLSLKPRPKHWDTRMDIPVSVQKAGYYLATVKLENGKTVQTVMRVDALTLVTLPIKDGVLYTVVNSLTGAPVPGAELEFLGYKQDYLDKRKGTRRYNTTTHSYTGKTDENGQYLWKANEKKRGYHQYSIKVSHERKSLYKDFHGNNHRDSASTMGTHSKTQSFGMTDRPVYQPEQSVKGKFWYREARYDMDETSRFSHQSFQVSILDPLGEQVGKTQEVKSDKYGGIEYTLDLAKDAKLGRYQVQLMQGGRHRGNHSFRVEKYKKPEYEVTVEAPKEPVTLGDSFQATIKATYFHGAPVTQATAKIKVLRHEHDARWFPHGHWDWLYGGGYGWFGVERFFYPGFRAWGCRCPVPFWYGRGHQQPELIMEQEFPLQADGTVQVTIDSALAKEIHGEKNQRYEITAEVVDASRRTIVGTGSTLATVKPYQVTVWLDKGHAKIGDKISAYLAAKTLDGRPVEAQGTLKVFKVSVDENGKVSEEEVASWEAETDAQGETSRALTCDVAGQFKISATLTDASGKTVTGATFITVKGEGVAPNNYAYNALELTLDKRTYRPGETAELLVKTARKDSYVTLFLRGGETHQLLKLSGQTTSVKIPITMGDMPNTFLQAFTVSDGQVHSVTTEVIVPPEKRVLNVEVVADKERYKPREDGTLSVKVTDENGEPVVGSVALTVYDKALEYISGGSNVGDIRDAFWKWRRYFYNSLNHSASYNIQNIYPNSVEQRKMENLGVYWNMVSVMTLAESLDFGDVDDFGMEASFGASASKDSFSIREPVSKMKKPVGRKTSTPPAASAPMAKVEQVPDTNQAGGSPVPMIRSNFADLVKWQGHVETSAEGIATLPVTFPDNLTTWKVKTWALTHGTRVGEGSTEVITSKDLIIRLQAPRFFVEKDEVTLSAVVHNYHDKPLQAQVSLELEGGTVEAVSPLTQEVSLEAENGEVRVDWSTKVKGEGEAIIRMSVVTSEDADAMEMTFPVHPHGILKQEAWSQSILPEEDSTRLTFTVPEQRDPAQSRLEVRYSPTIAGSIISALPYLAEYPYGCTEQTLNRFVPTVICQKLLQNLEVDLEAVRNQRANLNPQEIGDDQERLAQWKRWERNPVFSEKEVEKMTQKGVERLREMQNNDGGWGWFSGYGERSYPHTTAVVIHGLRTAHQNGAEVPDEMLSRGIDWLAQHEKAETLKLQNYPEKEEPYKRSASHIDAIVHYLLAEEKRGNDEMQGFLYRDKTALSTYGKSLLGLALHASGETEKRDAVLKNIEQLLVYDEENQSAYLNLYGNSGYWWNWYGSEMETHAWYLKLLARTAPKSKQARGIVKYLINNRKHATYWDSTRDTAYCIEAISEYLTASGEFNPEATVEIHLDGKLYKTVEITKENLFTYDNAFTVSGDVLTSGEHTIEIKKQGDSPLYTNTYLTNFTKEDHITKTGLEVKVERRYYKLTPEEATAQVTGSHGQQVEQRVEKHTRTRLNTGDAVASGDLILVELIIESKNDYEYLLFNDMKPAGCENKDVRSGYRKEGLRAYMEVHDEKSSFFLRRLPRGKHALTYELRAEIPGTFSALPTQAEAMYAPELRANSDELKLRIIE